MTLLTLQVLLKPIAGVLYRVTTGAKPRTASPFPRQHSWASSSTRILAPPGPALVSPGSRDSRPFKGRMMTMPTENANAMPHKNRRCFGRSIWWRGAVRCLLPCRDRRPLDTPVGPGPILRGILATSNRDVQGRRWLWRRFAMPLPSAQGEWISPSPAQLWRAHSPLPRGQTRTSTHAHARPRTPAHTHAPRTTPHTTHRINHGVIQ